MGANLSWLFYKDYFEGIEDYLNIDEKAIEKKVDEFIQTPVTIEAKEDEERLGNIHFKATTTYPGLLLGIGNGHELPSVKGQAILGFHFDYTTGLPEITGSSIKGVLRSAFNAKDNYGYIAELLYDEMKIDKKIDIKALELEIFEGTTKDSEGKDERMKQRDVFFDAYIINAVGDILGDDYLTPHGENPLIEPIPLRFIKVLPEVTFMFDFELYDGLLCSEDKELLFRLIIQDLGLGAKTNVGYGYFEEISVEKFKENKRTEATLIDIANESPIDKIIKEYPTIADIVGAYNQGLSERVIDYKDEFKKKILEELDNEIQGISNNKKKVKIEKRIEKVKAW